MDESTIDREAMGRLAKAMVFICGVDHPTTVALRTAAELAENAVKMLAGAADADYTQHYSDITGYLWTDAECVVGGHDLLDELESNVGKWCHMTVTFHPEPPSPAVGGKPEGRPEKGS